MTAARVQPALLVATWTAVVWALRLPLGLASRLTWALQVAEAWAVRRRECARPVRDGRREGSV